MPLTLKTLGGRIMATKSEHHLKTLRFLDFYFQSSLQNLTAVPNAAVESLRL